MVTDRQTDRQVGRQKAPFNPDSAASLQLHAQLASACLSEPTCIVNNALCDPSPLPVACWSVPLLPLDRLQWDALETKYQTQKQLQCNGMKCKMHRRPPRPHPLLYFLSVGLEGATQKGFVFSVHTTHTCQIWKRGFYRFKWVSDRHLLYFLLVHLEGATQKGFTTL